jgi:hypothetical protein
MLLISFSIPLHSCHSGSRTERRGRRVKGARLLRVHRSEAETLESPPALRTILAAGMEKRLLVEFSWILVSLFVPLSVTAGSDPRSGTDTPPGCGGWGRSPQ